LHRPALSRAHLYRPDTNLEAWLFTILRHIFISQSRVARHRRRYASEYLALSLDAVPPNQFHRVALKESLQVMKSLPTHQLQAVALLGFSDLTYEEAARHTGLKIGTMKSRASRGRRLLRVLLSDDA